MWAALKRLTRGAASPAMLPWDGRRFSANRQDLARIALRQVAVDDCCDLRLRAGAHGEFVAEELRTLALELLLGVTATRDVNATLHDTRTFPSEAEIVARHETVRELLAVPAAATWALAFNPRASEAHVIRENSDEDLYGLLLGAYAPLWASGWEARDTSPEEERRRLAAVAGVLALPSGWTVSLAAAAASSQVRRRA